MHNSSKVINTRFFDSEPSIKHLMDKHKRIMEGLISEVKKTALMAYEAQSVDILGNKIADRLGYPSKTSVVNLYSVTRYIDIGEELEIKRGRTPQGVMDLYPYTSENKGHVTEDDLKGMEAFRILCDYYPTCFLAYNRIFSLSAYRGDDDLFDKFMGITNDKYNNMTDSEIIENVGRKIWDMAKETADGISEVLSMVDQRYNKYTTREKIFEAMGEIDNEDFYNGNADKILKDKFPIEMEEEYWIGFVEHYKPKK